MKGGAVRRISFDVRSKMIWEGEEKGGDGLSAVRARGKGGERRGSGQKNFYLQYEHETKGRGH